MRVAGFGFRQAAPLESLREALAAAGGPKDLVALATVTQKATSPVLLALAEEMGLPVHALDARTLAHISTPSRSGRVLARYGTGSVAEAAALAAAGTGAYLLAPRAASADGMAMAAIAERKTP